MRKQLLPIVNSNDNKLSTCLILQKSTGKFLKGMLLIKLRKAPDYKNNNSSFEVILKSIFII